jgi:hypothetical protein
MFGRSAAESRAQNPEPRSTEKISVRRFMVVTVLITDQGRGSCTQKSFARRIEFGFRW